MSYMFYKVLHLLLTISLIDNDLICHRHLILLLNDLFLQDSSIPNIVHLNTKLLKKQRFCFCFLSFNIDCH
jgi:hypothetical protein